MVVMHVIDAALEIRLVPHQMLPEGPLPQSSLALLPSVITDSLACGDQTGELRFDQTPAHRVARAFSGEPPDRVQLLGDHHPGGDLEGVCRTDLPHGRTQHLHPIDQQAALAIRKVGREEMARHSDRGPAVALPGRLSFVDVGVRSSPQPTVLRDHLGHRLSQLMNENPGCCVVEPSRLLDNSLVMGKQDDLGFGGKVSQGIQRRA